MALTAGDKSSPTRTTEPIRTHRLPLPILRQTKKSRTYRQLKLIILDLPVTTLTRFTIPTSNTSLKPGDTMLVLQNIEFTKDGTGKSQKIIFQAVCDGNVVEAREFENLKPSESLGFPLILQVYSNRANCETGLQIQIASAGTGVSILNHAVFIGHQTL